MVRHHVLTAEWCHETNTFSSIPTTEQNFFAQYYFHSAEEIEKQRRGTKSVIGATYEAADAFGWDLTTTLCASANPSGALSADTFSSMADQLMSPLHRGDRFDGIVLHLHGAMVTESYEDAEGELLKRIREIAGPDIPIVVTLDLHANVTELMASQASILLAVRTYPHIDFYETAQRACQLLSRAMKGDITPRTVLAKRPMLRGLDGGKTHPQSPMTALIQRGEQLEQDGRCLVVSVCAGFMAADIYEIGPSVTVSFDASLSSSSSSSPASAAQDIAEELMDDAWATREYTSEHHLSISEAAALAAAFGASNEWEDRLVVADVADNPGSGHYGDTTDFLKALVEQDVRDACFYAIFDAEAAKQAQTLGVGNTGVLTLGGRGDPSLGGGPLTVTACVLALTNGCFRTYGPMGFGGVEQNFGLSALLRIGTSLDVVVISNNGQLLDIAQITSLGVDVLHKKVICVKSKYHFRASLEAIAKQVVTVDGGGLGSALLVGSTIRKDMYKKVRRPIWPLDPDVNN